MDENLVVEVFLVKDIIRSSFWTWFALQHESAAFTGERKWKLGTSHGQGFPSEVQTLNPFCWLVTLSYFHPAMLLFVSAPLPAAFTGHQEWPSTGHWAPRVMVGDSRPPASFNNARLIIYMWVKLNGRDNNACMQPSESWKSGWESLWRIPGLSKLSTMRSHQMWNCSPRYETFLFSRKIQWLKRTTMPTCSCVKNCWKHFPSLPYKIPCNFFENHWKTIWNLSWK